MTSLVGAALPRKVASEAVTIESRVSQTETMQAVQVGGSLTTQQHRKTLLTAAAAATAHTASSAYHKEKQTVAKTSKQASCHLPMPLQWYGARDVRVGEVPRPLLTDPGDAIVRITTAAICGSGAPGLHSCAWQLLHRRGALPHLRFAHTPWPRRIMPQTCTFTLATCRA